MFPLYATGEWRLCGEYPTRLLEKQNWLRMSQVFFHGVVLLLRDSISGTTEPNQLQIQILQQLSTSTSSSSTIDAGCCARSPPNSKPRTEILDYLRFGIWVQASSNLKGLWSDPALSGGLIWKNHKPFFVVSPPHRKSAWAADCRGLVCGISPASAAHGVDRSRGIVSDPCSLDISRK
jgi:hypothetical protein